MKRTFGILFAVILMVIMTGNLFAQEMMMKEMGKEKEATEAGAKKMMMGGQGMMGGGMMCPMCGKMMGDQGMMGGGMMPMMQGMMGGQGMGGSGMMQGMMGGMGMMDMKPHIAGMAEELDLSEEQQAKLKALHIANKKDMIRKKADKEIAEIDLQELIQQDEPDLEAIKGQIRKVTNLEADMKYAWVKLMVDAKSLLNANQRERFKKLMMGKKKPMMMGQMMSGKKAKANKPAPKAEPDGHSEHH